MKVLILDSGPLINLSMNGLLDILEKLKYGWQGKMIITDAVKYEVIDRPIGIQRFELGALRIKMLLENHILESPEILGASQEEIKKVTAVLMDKANHSFKVADTWVTLVSEAEMSCLALSTLLAQKGHETLIAIDERTTRLLCEKPEALEKVMSERFHQKVSLVSSDIRQFKDYKFIRSSELIYVAYTKKILGLEGKKALEAALYAAKFKGAAISFEEIDTLKKM